jgi:serine/threonine-protein kinase RsbW
VISGSAVLDLAMGASLAPVLRRVASAVAAQGGLTVDRISDLLLIVDAVAAGAERQLDGARLRVAVTPAPGRVSVRMGPLAPGGAERLVEACRVPQIGSVLEALADEVRTESDGAGDYLMVVVGEPPAAA